MSIKVGDYVYDKEYEDFSFIYQVTNIFFVAPERHYVEVLVVREGVINDEMDGYDVIDYDCLVPMDYKPNHKYKVGDHVAWSLSGFDPNKSAKVLGISPEVGIQGKKVKIYYKYNLLPDDLNGENVEDHIFTTDEDCLKYYKPAAVDFWNKLIK